MSKALNYRSIEHGLLDLLIIPDFPLAGCNHTGRTSVVMMGRSVPGLFAVRKVRCGRGCKHATRMLSPEERATVRTKLEIAANLVRELQVTLGMDADPGTIVQAAQPRLPFPFTQKDADIEISDSTDQGSETESETEAESETGAKQPAVNPLKRKGKAPENRVFKRQALPLLLTARGSETDLTLASGEAMEYELRTLCQGALPGPITVSKCGWEREEGSVLAPGLGHMDVGKPGF
ncbi:hypothetical protein FA13DRAFT_1717638 [Coprinellus micaceus]|uniref:Uncharacterized protein n=1 Tax=Coprinellus micaceus TaxID=71717 RepID=A0A4Y7SGB2_COPMI|nr:hypothetical protein FA13DRAFT_1717638 [Coprinellus micaceus]